MGGQKNRRILVVKHEDIFSHPDMLGRFGDSIDFLSRQVLPTEKPKKKKTPATDGGLGLGFLPRNNCLFS